MSGEPSGNAGTVLIVDDDSAMRELLKDWLEREGFRVIEQSDGEQLLAGAQTARFDAVILDKEMPGASGFDVLAFLRRFQPESPVIFITAFGGSRAKEEALRLGASRYIEKPFRVAELVEVVRTVIKAPDAPAAPQRLSPKPDLI